jgi:Uncharacterized protein conserved in bacteria
MLCPCHSDHLFADCCQPLLDGKTAASTPEQLMRSRFTAYALHNWHYLLKSWHPESRPNCTIDDLENDAQDTEWVNLEIINASESNADNGEVEFKAWYRHGGQLHCLHERSRFIHTENGWSYLDGTFCGKAGKIKPNESCPCGSGKKYKKCCGA